MAASPAPESHLPLSVPVYQILLSLARVDLHGYAIIRDIAERTSGGVELTASTLYGALPRMLADGTIEEVPSASGGDGDGRRRSYRITEFGRTVARAEAGRLTRAVEQARAQGVVPDGDPVGSGRTR